MNDTNIQNLISLLEAGKITKSSFVAAVNNIQFKKEHNEFNGNIDSSDIIVSDTCNDEEKDNDNLKDHLTCINEYSNCANNTSITYDKGLRGCETEDSSVLCQKVTTMSNEESSSISIDNCFEYIPKAINREPHTKFLSRLTNYKNCKELRQKVLRDQLRIEEEKKCSFKPKINHNVSPRNRRIYDNNWNKMNMEQRHLEKQRFEREELAKCTFKPEVYSKSAKPRYMDLDKVKDDLTNLHTGGHGTFEEKKSKFRRGVTICFTTTEKNTKNLSVDP